MENSKIYEDIAQRTGGNIYIGVVGPVRTGKSTFIKRFMETLVIPNIENVYSRERAKDELPQSGSGRTIMTAEPKFVPEEAVEVSLEGGSAFSVRLIDCVGYMVEGAIGQTEDGEARMVSTPWFDYEIPMAEAAEIGTRKVIAEHSTIGIVVTTDGSITDISGESYLEPERRVIEELLELNKPFIVLVNSANPSGAAALEKVAYIESEYCVSVMACNCLELKWENIEEILKSVLYEFPVSDLGIYMPGWIETLPDDHKIKSELFAALIESTAEMKRICDVERVIAVMRGHELLSNAVVNSIDLGTGSAIATVEMPRELFYETISSQSGFEIRDDGDLMSLLTGLSKIKNEYDKVEKALEEVRMTGYGIVTPSMEEMSLEEPEIVKQSGRYGVRLRASAPSIHIERIKQKYEFPKRDGRSKQNSHSY